MRRMLADGPAGQPSARSRPMAAAFSVIAVPVDEAEVVALLRDQSSRASA